VCEISSLEVHETAKTLIENLRDEMYLQRKNDAALERMYLDTLTKLNELELDERELFYRKSQAAYYMAKGYLAFDTTEEALEADREFRDGSFAKVKKRYKNLEEITRLLEESMLFSEQYLSMGRDARGIRQHAESLSQIVTLKTMSYLFSHGPKIQSLAREAVKLDPGDIKAHMLIASRYIYSPSIFGGNPAKGIETIEAIAQRGLPDREDAHTISIALGVAHSKLNRWLEAAHYFRRAQEIYPGNIYSAAMLLLCEDNLERERFQ